MKKIVKLIAVSVAAVVLLGSCAKNNASSSSSGSAANSVASEKVVKLGVVGSIYEDLWTPAQAALKKEGIKLQIVQFSDYVTPNNALANSEIDLNAFQHRIYLATEIKNHNYEIATIGNTFIIPLNLYSSKIKSPSELKKGDKVAIPNDVTNGGRALKVLEAAGVIGLDAAAGFNPTVDDITSNPYGVEILQLAANTLPASLSDVAAAVVNGNYALDFGLKTDEAIFKDSVLDEVEYWNLIAAKKTDLHDTEKLDTFKKVVAAFQSPETEKVFNDTFGGYFIKVGWDADEFATALAQ